jgi:hypothetical protein
MNLLMLINNYCTGNLLSPCIKCDGKTYTGITAQASEITKPDVTAKSTRVKAQDIAAHTLTTLYH